MPQFKRLPAETLEKLKLVSTATASGMLLKIGIRNTFMEGVYPLCPDKVMVGQAFTLRYLPRREDIEEERGSRPRPQRLAIEGVGPGDVLVVDARGEMGCAVAGDILLTRVKVRGAAGFVTDGTLRDTPYIRTMDYPVYVRGANGQPSTRDFTDIGVNEPVACGGVAVLPGDVILGDGEGVVVIPLKHAQKIADEGWERERLEVFIREQVEKGASTLDAYPPNEEYMRRYQEWVKAQK
ncbi:MAG: ribonuclease activity regulator RraA [Bacteroidetes bacterium]|nr:ribonuclease activity regulator RraA [Bacteroidota bacterium]MCL5025928.1 ribonuclease activity regulator RraA [Chloroflexota bacterium]